MPLSSAEAYFATCKILWLLGSYPCYKIWRRFRTADQQPNPQPRGRPYLEGDQEVLWEFSFYSLRVLNEFLEARMRIKTKHFYEFNGFRVDPGEGLLLHGDEAIPLPPKALDLLLFLVENAGHVLSKEELMKRLWPDSFVEEANLSHHIFNLRKALGDDKNAVKFIETIPRRGYRFVANVTEMQDESGEFVVAEHSQSHIVVEEYTVAASDTGFQPRHPHKRSLLESGLARNESQRKPYYLFSAALVAVLALGVASYFWILRKPPQEPAALGVRSIAVLPFKPLSAEHRDEALELGMADTLINKLSPIRHLIVRPISEVRQYTKLEQDPVTAGRELGVDYVLEGNLQMVGDKTRATMRLLRMSDGSAVWTDKCDQQCSTIFALQDAIAERIVGTLALKLTSDEQKKIIKRYTDDSEAYRLALIGRYHWNQWTSEGWKKSIDYYNQAIEKEPNYALAYAWMSAAYLVQANNGLISQREAHAKAKPLVQKALDLDGELDDGYYQMAALKLFYEWDWDGAERELKRAFELNPNHPEGRLLYAYYLMIKGRTDESLREVERCQELNPVSAFIGTEAADMLYFARRYDEALAQYRKTLSLDPNFTEAHWGLAMVYAQKGMTQEALLEINTITRLVGVNEDTMSALGYLYALMGRRAAAQEIVHNLEKITKQGYFDPIKIVYIYAALGEKDRAFEWLERAYNERPVGMKWLNVNPKFDNLRKDQRFTDMQRRVGLLP
jgi:DNA-binding winged helix-turn-helix (wHTH) protein/TolB-like protein/Flp pilus assembly protein TadD